MKKIYLIFIIILILSFLLSIFPYSYANDELVYVDNNDIDTRYHRITCSHISPNSYHSITVEEAFNIGYRRCSDCSPPMSDFEYNERMKTAKEIINSINPQSNTYQISDRLENIINDVNGNVNSTESAPKKYVYVTDIDRGYAPCKICNPYELASAEIAEEKAEKRETTTKIIILISICVLILVVYIIFNEKRYKR